MHVSTDWADVVCRSFRLFPGLAQLLCNRVHSAPVCTLLSAYYVFLFLSCSLAAWVSASLLLSDCASAPHGHRNLFPLPLDAPLWLGGCLHSSVPPSAGTGGFASSAGHSWASAALSSHCLQPAMMLLPGSCLQARAAWCLPSVCSEVVPKLPCYWRPFQGPCPELGPEWGGQALEAGSGLAWCAGQSDLEGCETSVWNECGQRPRDCWGSVEVEEQPWMTERVRGGRFGRKPGSPLGGLLNVEITNITNVVICNCYWAWVWSPVV